MSKVDEQAQMHAPSVNAQNLPFLDIRRRPDAPATGNSLEDLHRDIARSLCNTVRTRLITATELSTQSAQSKLSCRRPHTLLHSMTSTPGGTLNENNPYIQVSQEKKREEELPAPTSGV